MTVIVGRYGPYCYSLGGINGNPSSHPYLRHGVCTYPQSSFQTRVIDGVTISRKFCVAQGIFLLYASTTGCHRILPSVEAPEIDLPNLSVWPSECVDSVHILFVFRFYSLRSSLILTIRSRFNVLIWCIVFAPSLYASRCSNSLLSYTYSPLLRASRTLLISSWGTGVSETRPEWLFTSYPAREV